MFRLEDIDHGAVPGDLIDHEPGFQPWPGTKEEHLRRIAAETTALGRLPETGETGQSRANTPYPEPSTVTVSPVTDTPPVIKGSTATNQLKEATLETGLTIKVPAFIKTGDLISVDTSTGAYRERVKD